MTRNKDVNKPGNGGKFATATRAESDLPIGTFDEDAPNLSPEAQKAVLDILKGYKVGDVNLQKMQSFMDAHPDAQVTGVYRSPKPLSPIEWDATPDEEFPPSFPRDPAIRDELLSMSAAELRALPDASPYRKTWVETVEWAESKGFEPMSHYLGSARTKSIGELVAEVNAPKPTDEDIQAARDLLDDYEHFAGHAGFIAEAGGTDKYADEHRRRARTFITLNSRSSTPAEVTDAMATLKSLREENGL
jgi:hypothetical protein